MGGHIIFDPFCWLLFFIRKGMVGWGSACIMCHFSVYKLLQYVRFNLEVCSDWGGWVEWSHVLCPLLISSYPTPCSGRRHKDHGTDATAFLAGEESRSQGCESCIQHYFSPVTWNKEPTYISLHHNRLFTEDPSYGILRRVDWQVVKDVSANGSKFAFRVTQFKV